MPVSGRHASIWSAAVLATARSRRLKSSIVVVITVAAVAAAAGSVALASEWRGAGFSSSDAIQNCQSLGVRNIHSPASLHIPILTTSMDGNVGAVAYGNSHWVVLCLSGTGSTDLGWPEEVEHAVSLQTLQSGTGDYGEFWSVIHTAPGVRNVTFAGPYGETATARLGNGLWLLFARQSLANVYSEGAASGLHSIGVLIAFGRDGSVLASGLLRRCKFESMTNRNRC